MIIRHDRNDADHRLSFGAYPAVGCVEGSGHAKGIVSLVHPRWVLTVAHAAAHLVPGQTVRFGSTPRCVRRVELHPSWADRPARPNRAALANFADLALVELVDPLEGVKPLVLNAGSGEAGAVVTLVGNGGTGTGLTGAVHRDGLWRAATNRLEEVLHDSWLTLRFDESGRDMPLEGFPGIGDSGAPALLQRGGHLLVVGVTSWEDASEAHVRGGYGALKFLMRTAAYRPWIKEVLGAAGDVLADEALDGECSWYEPSQADSKGMD